MEIGYSSSTRLLMKFLTENTKKEIDRYVEEHRNNEPIEYNFQEDTDEFGRSLTDEEYMTIRLYTGTNYKNINAVLRNTWNYEDNGDSSKKDYYKKLGEDISNVIDKYPELKNNIKTFRGTSLREFKKYGVTNLEELKQLEGKYLYEEGFTSTSLEEKSSFFNREIFGEIQNIEVIYHILESSQDGMPILSKDLSYCINQKEYILNKNCLSKILKVEIKDDTAIVEVLLIPQKLWNKEKYMDSEKVDTNIKK